MHHLSDWELAVELKKLFGIDGVEVREAFPYVLPTLSSSTKKEDVYSEARIDGREPYMSIPLAMSALVLLTLCGIVGCLYYRPEGTTMSILLGAAVSGASSILF